MAAGPHFATQIASNLLLAAKRWVKLPAEDLKAIEEQRRCVNVLRSHRHRRELLAQFDDRDVLRALFELPERAFDEAERLLKDTLRHSQNGPRQKAAKLHETALAMAILFAQPIRVGNLADLDLVKHFQRDRDARLRRIFVDPGDVKNAVAIQVEIPDRLGSRLERHFKVFRPLLLKKQSGALFVGKDGGPMQAATIGRRMRKLVEQQLGARFTPHLARHLAAELLLDKDVHNLPVAQRLLGHLRPETTAHIYGMVRTSAAQSVYSRLLEQDILSQTTDGRSKLRGRKAA
jgi:integrase